MADLILPLKTEYFDAIKAGEKPEEFRLANAYWTRRLHGADGQPRTFDRIVLTKGYPKRGDDSRRLVRPWKGFTRKTLTHPHFGADPVEVFAIHVRETFGNEEGEVCWRNGCQGVIALRSADDMDGGCSCHINPPCGFCTTPREHCPVCDWDADEEMRAEYLNGFRMKVGDLNADGYKPIISYERRPLDPRKIDYHIISTGTGCTQKCEGVYPEGTTSAQVLEKVKGTFGGRFESFGGGKFTYIAYTD